MEKLYLIVLLEHCPEVGEALQCKDIFEAAMKWMSTHKWTYDAVYISTHY